MPDAPPGELGVEDAPDADDFAAVPAPDHIGGTELRRHAPDQSLLVTEGPDKARCSLWWRTTPLWQGKRTGFIGHYAATDAHLGARLLREACHRLARQGCQTAIGPIDGSTWRRYRALSQRGDEPTFLLEPDNPDDWPATFAQAGFTPMAHYVSSLVPPQPPAAGAQRGEEALRSHGITLRTLDLEDFRAELTRLHPMALRSFASNLLYTHLPLQEFLAQYEPYAPHLDARILWLAEQDGRPVGCSFALPDLLQRQRGQPVTQAILKTLAVDPPLASQGLGALLAARNLQSCWDAGYRRVIGALMHESNRSRRISDHYGPAFRRYQLYARPLEAQ